MKNRGGPCDALIGLVCIILFGLLVQQVAIRCIDRRLEETERSCRSPLPLPTNAHGFLTFQELEEARRTCGPATRPADRPQDVE